MNGTTTPAIMAVLLLLLLPLWLSPVSDIIHINVNDSIRYSMPT